MMEHVDCERIVQVAELRAAIMAMPYAAREQLRYGPRPEPHCGICTAVEAGGDCGHDTVDYHEVGVWDMLALVGGDDIAAIADTCTTSDQVEALVKALAGALAAERALVVYLLAGWTPWKDQVKHARAAMAEATP